MADRAAQLRALPAHHGHRHHVFDDPEIDRSRARPFARVPYVTGTLPDLAREEATGRIVAARGRV